LPETNLKKIDVYVPTPEYEVDVKQIDSKQPIFQQSDKPQDDTPIGVPPEKNSDPIPIPRDPVITIASLDKQYMASFQPAYPPSARRADIEGTVFVRVRIGVDGKVITATIEKSSTHDILDSAAIQHALRKWRFKPATQDGKPIEGVRVISVVFQLKHEG
jgi:periplasmic protein TonB